MARQDQATIIDVVAGNVRQLRKAAGLSQEELAHEADLDRTYISQVERRQRNVTITVLARLAAALGVGPERLLIKPLAGKKRD
ncbi:helix-turn-helix transcriptional regulator [Bradyrhizobium sp. 151]|uniref:helix-turn-helix domain-containing protein n=1 Tax=Bradyrhizobium sp. 151 TaxID=2782626 RepID=UPI001FFAF0F8|nr:helix-turn-helix transcriptional regulator [Bradyrhizobium sp. 151]MCK1658584.1 helix-turn-helix transcriptional regulator [Bradyrhizobium sp. 151]